MYPVTSTSQRRIGNQTSLLAIYSQLNSSSSASSHRFWTDQDTVHHPCGVLTSPFTGQDKVTRGEIEWSWTDSQASREKALLSVERVFALVNHLSRQVKKEKVSIAFWLNNLAVAQHTYHDLQLLDV